jgi:glycosyltransferase involved in cell wall biosynthesis
MLLREFEWEVDLDGGEIVTLRTEHAFESSDDPRELGIAVSDLAVRVDGHWKAVSLEDDFETVARREAPSAWVASLIAVAQRRARDEDSTFFDVRGPHSGALEEWLRANVGSYDVVLTQGTPFVTPAVVADIAAEQNVPVVQLPHFHMEDRYYHWRRYYDMFASARRVVASSRSAKTAFFDVIGAPSVVLPGGGVDPGEFDAAYVERARVAFRTLHPPPNPFVLVLGRKTGAKRYRLVVDAVAALNARGHSVDLVLLGPDEDGARIDAPYVYAYGERPRDLVVGALACALCLANLSESESFGIVLLESWLAGRPVVAQRRCVAFTDLVVHGENGFLAETAEEVAQAVETYINDPECATRHAEAGRDVAVAFTWSRIAAQFESVLLDSAGALRVEAAAQTTAATPDRLEVPVCAGAAGGSLP